jgi:hypothetical protein
MYATKSQRSSPRQPANRTIPAFVSLAPVLALVLLTGCVFTSIKSGDVEVDMNVIRFSDPKLERRLPYEATSADSDLIFVLAQNKVFQTIGVSGTTIFRFWSDTPYSPSEAVPYIGHLGDFHFKVQHKWPWGTGLNAFYFPVDFILGWLNVPTGGLVPCFWDGDINTKLVIETRAGDELTTYESKLDVGAWGWVPLVYGRMQFLCYEGRIYNLRQCLHQFVVDYDKGTFDKYLAEIGRPRAVASSGENVPRASSP